MGTERKIEVDVVCAHCLLHVTRPNVILTVGRYTNKVPEKQELILPRKYYSCRQEII